jgi:hypothetical protein
MSKTVQPALVVKGTPVKPPKHILVNGHKIRFRFIKSVVSSVVLTALTVAAAAAVYYVTTQKGIFFSKLTWDNLLHYTWWPNYRHGLRDDGEPVAAAMLVHSFIYAGWKKHYGEHLPGLRLAGHVIVSLVSAFLLIILGVYVTHYVPGVSHYASSSTNTGIAGSLNLVSFALAFVISFIIVHFVRFAWGPVGNTIAGAITETAVRRAKGGTPFWVRHELAPPTMLERFAWTQQNTPVADMQTGRVVRWLVALGALVYFVLAVYGEYILHVIAKGK